MILLNLKLCRGRCIVPTADVSALPGRHAAPLPERPHASLSQDTREGYPYYGRSDSAAICWSMVRIPLAGILGRLGGWGILRRWSLLLLALSLLFFFLPIPSVHAATTGRIYGQLVDGTRKNVPLPGQSVTLQMAQGNTAQDVTKVKTDAHGDYSFANLDTASNISYAVYTNYQGAQYISSVVTLNTKPQQQDNLTVYEATTSMHDVAIVRATVLLREPDAQKGLVSVSELYIFRNLNARTYVGSLDASHGKPNALLFALPHTARNVVLGKGFDGYTAIQVDHGFASNAAVPPGDSQFAFTFDMPYTNPDYDFDYTVQYPTLQLLVLLPHDISASSSTFTAQGQVPGNQSSLNLFQATGLLANQVVHLELGKLPTKTPVSTDNTSSPSASPIPPWFLIALGIMAAIILGTWLLYRTMRRPPPPKKKPLASQKRAESEKVSR